MATRSAEQYLKVLLAFEGSENVTMTQIAQRLGVSSASVTGMAKRLSSKGLLRHQPYGGIELTPEGRDIAVRLLRRHRIAELYLFEKLSYPLYLVHDEADALEHHMSDYLEERMSEALENPVYDPHGHPIPGVDGQLPEVAGRTLPEAPLEETFHVASVPDSDPLFLRHLVDIGCVPGAQLQVTYASPETSTVSFRIRDNIHSVSEDKAGDILLCSPGEQQSRCFDDFLSHMKSLGD